MAHLGAPSDKGWLAGLQDGGLPYDLRGDRDGLSRFAWRSAVGWDELASRLEEFAVAGGVHGIAEERRLAYVPATRARHALLLTAHVWGRPKTPRVTSRFLDEVVARLPVRARGSGSACGRTCRCRRRTARRLVKPGTEDGHEFTWPVDHLAHRRVRADAAARAVSDAVAVASGHEADGATGSDVVRGDRGGDSSTGAPWAARSGRCSCRARLRASPRHDEVVELPSHLSTSALVALAEDPERFAARAAPADAVRARAKAARRGTAFHAWVEEHYSRAAIVDLVDLPGSADDDPMADEELAAMRERLPGQSVGVAHAGRGRDRARDGGRRHRAAWSHRRRVRATWQGAELGRRRLEDRATARRGARAAVRALQLSAYRLAWARLRG